ncbi:hypothetical protein JYQ62_33770 [Nostoc sp. UHCC 0702]|nr:hypothetical protein JYQ62_33770 [Nostoc sp. UHCC 0702]
MLVSLATGAACWGRKFLFFMRFFSLVYVTCFVDNFFSVEEDFVGESTRSVKRKLTSSGNSPET